MVPCLLSAISHPSKGPFSLPVSQKNSNAKTTLRHINSSPQHCFPSFPLQQTKTTNSNHRQPGPLLHSAGDSDVCVETKPDFLKPSSKTVATRSSSFWTDALMKWGRPEERDILATFHAGDDELTCVTSENSMGYLNPTRFNSW